MTVFSDFTRREPSRDEIALHDVSMLAGVCLWNTECSDDAFDVFGFLAEMIIVTVDIRVTHGLGL